MCVIVKTKCFIILPLIRNKSKTKAIRWTVFETFINNDPRYKTQQVSWWVLLVGDARNIHKSFFIQNHYWSLKLSIVAPTSVITCFP